jgi:hypothetical protein
MQRWMWSTWTISIGVTRMGDVYGMTLAIISAA